MHFPLNLTIGNFSIPLHLLLETLAIFTGFRYFIFLRRNHSDYIDTSGRMWIVTGAIFGSVLGSRLLGGLENIPGMMNSENIFFHFYANKTIVGGLLGGLIGVELMKKVIGEKRSSGDLFTYPLILAMIIGRVGCYSMGIYEETYGEETTLFTGMDLGDGKMRHPVTLYEISFLMLLWVVLNHAANKYLLARGGLFKLFMISYLVFRLVLDFIKPHFTFSVGLSSIQLACIGGLIYYGPFILKPKKLLAAYA